MGIRRIKITLALGALLSLNPGYSQSLNDKYGDSEVAFEEYRSTFEYYWDESNQEIRVKQTDEVILVPLKTNANFSWPIFYNDQIELGDFDLRNQKGRKYRYQKICGHVEQSGIFYSDARVCTHAMTFDIKNEFVNLTSERIYKDPRYFTKINFQFIIPGKVRKIRIIWPEWVDTEFVTLNFETFDIKKIASIENGKNLIEYTWDWPESYTNKEKNAPSTSFYTPHIIALTKSYTRPGSDKKIDLINDLGGLYNWYKTLVSNVNNEKGSLAQTVSNLTKEKSPEEQIKSIYYWVQDNIKYIAFEDGIMGFQPEDAHTVFEKKYGDCKGMANLLKAMLEIAGFDARLSWLGTTHLPYTYEIPSLAVDNHMICSVILDDNPIYLDATVKYNKLSYAPGHIQGKEILIENGDSYMLNKIPVADSDDNFEKIDLEMSISDGFLKSNGRIQMEGDYKQFFLYMYNNLLNSTKDRFARDFISESGETQDFEFEINEVSRDSTLTIDIVNESDHLISEYDGELYVQMELRNEFSSDKIDTKRKTPYAFDNRRHIRSKSNLTIPEGYKVTYVPEPLSIRLAGYSFNLQYEIKGDQIVYEKTIDIENLILDPSQFESWNESIKKLNEYYNNPIILSNAQ